MLGTAKGGGVGGGGGGGSGGGGGGLGGGGGWGAVGVSTVGAFRIIYFRIPSCSHLSFLLLFCCHIYLPPEIIMAKQSIPVDYLIVNSSRILRNCSLSARHGQSYTDRPNVTIRAACMHFLSSLLLATSAVCTL